MDDSERRAALLRRMGWGVLALVLAIAALSAFIRLDRAGLGCADWPACYGRALSLTPARPSGEGAGVAAARLVHRVVASAALVVVLLIAMTSLAARPRRWQEVRWALGLLALVLGLAALGRFSAHARLPAVALGNLLGGFLMAVLAWRLAREAGRPSSPATPLARASRLAFFVLLAQAALGGLVSAGYAGLACPGWACQTADLPWHAFDPWREPVLGVAGNIAGARLQLAHRTGAAIVGVVLVVLAIAAWRGGRRAAAVALLGLLAVQFALGVALVVGRLPLPAALAHNAVALLLLLAVTELASPPAARLR